MVIDLKRLRQGEIRHLGGTDGGEGHAERGTVAMPDRGRFRQFGERVLSGSTTAALFEGGAEATVVEHGRSGQVGRVQGAEAVQRFGAQRGEAFAEGPFANVLPGLGGNGLAIGGRAQIGIGQIGQLTAGGWLALVGPLGIQPLPQLPKLTRKPATNPPAQAHATSHRSLYCGAAAATGSAQRQEFNCLPWLKPVEPPCKWACLLDVRRMATFSRNAGNQADRLAFRAGASMAGLGKRQWRSMHLENTETQPGSRLDDDGSKARRLERLRRDFLADARFSQVFAVLTVGSSLIASFGLLADSAAVVIGAMVVAPWMQPLQAMAFQVLQGSVVDLLRALRTLLLGVLIAVGVSVSVGWLSGLPNVGGEVLGRTNPTLLDLGVALTAGSTAMYARLRQEAISALAGLAIAVALVPPICAMGLCVSIRELALAGGAWLLFLTNLLGILSGGMLALGLLEPSFRRRLLASRLGLTSLALTALLVVPLGNSFLRLLGETRRRAEAQRIESLLAKSLRNETITLGLESELESINIRWNEHPPVVVARVNVNDPDLPSVKQVTAVQAFINRRLAPHTFRLVVQRTAIAVIAPQ